MKIEVASSNVPQLGERPDDAAETEKYVEADRARMPAGWVVRFTEARVNAPNLSPLAYNTVDVWANWYEIDRETGVVVKSRVHVAALRGKDRPAFGPGTPVPP